MVNVPVAALPAQGALQEGLAEPVVREAEQDQGSPLFGYTGQSLPVFFVQSVAGCWIG